MGDAQPADDGLHGAERQQITNGKYRRGRLRQSEQLAPRFLPAFQSHNYFGGRLVLIFRMPASTVRGDNQHLPAATLATITCKGDQPHPLVPMFQQMIRCQVPRIFQVDQDARTPAMGQSTVTTGNSAPISASRAPTQEKLKNIVRNDNDPVYLAAGELSKIAPRLPQIIPRDAQEQQGFIFICHAVDTLKETVVKGIYHGR